jgi:hypothetical protein
MVRRKTQQRTDVTRGKNGFLRNFDTGQQNRLPHLRYAKRYGFHQCSEPGTGNKRIRSCVKAPLKNFTGILQRADY